MRYGFDKKTLKLAIKVLTDEEREDLAPVVTELFKLDKSRIKSNVNKNDFYLPARRVIATIDVGSGELYFTNGLSDTFINVSLSYSYQTVECFKMEEFPICDCDLYIMKPLINTRYNRLKGAI
jgi:hypothetical protein